MLLGILGCLFTSCFSDLDTMPLDDNELVSERSIRQPTAIQEYWQNATAHLSSQVRKVATVATVTLRVPTKDTLDMCASCSTCRSCQQTT